MAVDLEDLVEPLKYAVNPPGQTLVSATDPEWVSRLANAFWRAKVHGHFSGFRVDPDGETIVPVDDDDDDMPREHQQLVVMYAAFEALEAEVRNLDTVFRASAATGVEFETQRSAQLLIELLKGAKEELAILKASLLEDSYAAEASFADLLLLRDENMLAALTHWVT